MPKRKSKGLPKVQVAYSESDSEYDDEIQTFYRQKDKILLDSDQEEASDGTENEEVYRLEESSDDDQEIVHMQQQLRQLKRNAVKKKLGSDLENDTEDEALPDSRAWGSKKSWFMGGDVRDNKIILSGDEDEAGAAVLEEKEMQEIEKRQMARMSAEDYMPTLLLKQLKKKEEKKKKVEKKAEKKKSKKAKEKKSSDSEDSDAEKSEEPDKTKKKKKDKKKKAKSDENGTEGLEKIKVQTDFSKLPEGAEFERLKERHPEYVPLMNDFKMKMEEFQERIMPLMGLVKDKKMDGLGATYVRLKYHIIANYLICGGFYVYFLSKKTPRLHYHPVLKRLVELQQYYKRLEPLDSRLKTVLDEILEQKRQGQDIGKIISEVPDPNTHTSAKTKKTKKARKAKSEDGPSAKKRKVMQETGFEEDGEDEGGDDNDMDFDNDDEAEGDDDGEQERRAITYQMEKNKGLVAHKKKELKNPRVKHRTKYRRALIRRKGQVRDYKPSKTAYTGEKTGIRAGIIRSRKFR